MAQYLTGTATIFMPAVALHKNPHVICPAGREGGGSAGAGKGGSRASSSA